MSKTSEPRGIDLEEREERGAEAPSPHAGLVVFVSSFVDVEDFLIGQASGEVVVGAGHAVRNLGDDFGEIAATDFDAEEIAEEAFDGGVRAVAGAFEITDQGGKSRPCEPGPGGRRIESRVMDLLALAAPDRMRANAGDRDHFGRQRQIDLLNDFGGQLAGSDRPMTIGTLGTDDFGVMDVGVVEGIAKLGFVSGLGSAFATAAVIGLGFRLVLLAEVAGGRLGGVAGILFQRSDLGLETRDFGSQLLDQVHQSVASCARGHPCCCHDARAYSTAANEAIGISGA